MLGRKKLVESLLKNPQKNQSASFCTTAAEKGKSKTFSRRVVPFLLFSLTGGVALSAALEKASQSQAVLEALGEPIERGPWYNASLAVAHNRNDALLPVLFPFLRHQNWEILMMEALVHIPSNEEKNQTLRINLSDAAASAMPYPGNEPLVVQGLKIPKSKYTLES
ncbi:hypothetical protein MKX01_039291 [Papaver californicum]|nr:hypothetical protein MKX01_039291 [Papaver californicum]